MNSPDLISMRRMLGGGAPGWGSAGGRRAVSVRFQETDQLRGALHRVAEKKIDGLVSVGSRELFAVLGAAPDPALPPVLPIVPNIQGFMREAVEHGIVGAGFQRLRRVGLAPLTGLALRGMGRAHQLLQRDFPTMLLCFIELELADFRRFRPRIVFLQPQMTDLALAMDNPRIIEAFMNALRRCPGAKPGFMTQNLRRLAERLERWGAAPAGIIAPVESTGAGMRPDQTGCEKTIAALACPIWADRSGRPEPPSRSELDYFARVGVAGALRDDDELLFGATGGGSGNVGEPGGSHRSDRSDGTDGSGGAGDPRALTAF